MIINSINVLDQKKYIVDYSAFTTTNDYLQQYRTALIVMGRKANDKRYMLNIQFMPFLFIFRHCVELYLKDFGAKGNHNIKELAQQIPTLNYQEFLSELNVLECDSLGECFRYLEDKSNNRFFNGKTLNVLNAYNYFCSILSEDVLPLNQKTEKNLTFHTKDVTNIGVIATQYSYAISTLMESIESGDVEFKEICLPLLFLIRHALELELKDNINTLKEDLNFLVKTNKRSLHSLASLFNNTKDIYKQVYPLVKDPIYLADLKNKERSLANLTNTIDQLDSLSQYFRFPFDSQNNNWGYNPPHDFFIQVYELYMETDSFLTFAILSFIEEGLISKK